jgi:thymidylate synthase (FAD)
MNIVQPYALLLAFDDSGNQREFTREIGIGLLRRIEFTARISHRSEDQQVESSWERFLKFVVVTKGDWSVVEHVNVTVDMLVDRGITHELVRHRLFSFTQESTRFVNYDKKMPPSFIRPELNDEARKIWDISIDNAEWRYRDLIAQGCAPQIARSVFPNALASRIIITGNLRNWRHFLIMRTTKESHPQMRQVTIPLLAEFQAKIPILFDDLVAGQSQSEAIKKAR